MIGEFESASGRIWTRNQFKKSAARSKQLAAVSRTLPQLFGSHSHFISQSWPQFAVIEM